MYLKLLPIFLLSLSFSITSHAAKVIGQFQVVKGKVEVISKRGRKKKASFGKRIKEGDTIVTAKDSRAKVVMLDKNIIHVSPDSKMRFGKYNQKIANKTETVLDVVYGKIRTNVKQKYDDDKTKFRVQTKAAVAGVRGTDFLSGYDQKKNKADFLTFEGEIGVGLLGPDGELTNVVPVGAGERSSFNLGDLPTEGEKVPDTELEKENKETNVKGGKDTYDPKAPDGEGGEQKKDNKGNKNDNGKSPAPTQKNSGSNDPSGGGGDSSEGWDSGPGGDDLSDTDSDFESDDLSVDTIDDVSGNTINPNEIVDPDIQQTITNTVQDALEPANLNIDVNLND